jgi:hypothetical protein
MQPQLGSSAGGSSTLGPLRIKIQLGPGPVILPSHLILRRYLGASVLRGREQCSLFPQGSAMSRAEE